MAQKGHNNWLPPRDAKKLFSSKAEDELRKRHPVWYWVQSIITVVLVVAPLIGYFVLMQSALRAEANQLLAALIVIAGMIGPVGVVLGLHNLLSLFNRQYLGHLITAGGILGGSAWTYLMLCLLRLL